MCNPESNEDGMEEDKWGKNPSVQMMRRVFASIEEAQAALLREAHVSPMDGRLGLWRRVALKTFERRWTEFVGAGTRLQEKDVLELYLRCLAEVLQKDGIGPNGRSTSSPLIEHIHKNDN
jgi:hypothetical protein